MDRTGRGTAEGSQESLIDRQRLAGETRVIFGLVKKQVFNQIPNLSGIGGLLVGAWVSATFTTSQWKGVLASWGIMKGATKVVSPLSYKLLSIFLPIFAAAVTAYFVQKALKAYRERQLERNMAVASLFNEKTKDEIKGKLDILQTALSAGLLTESEFSTKKADLYQSYSSGGKSAAEEFIVRKLAG